MSATREETVRIAFAKYLLSLAKQQILLTEPLASVGLLLLHDSVEHLLVLSCYRVGVDPRKSDFPGYWSLIEKSSSGITIPEKGRMGALNSARVALKHGGVQPSRAQLVEFQNLVLSFFDNVVPLIFGSSFDSINLTAFVVNDDARKRLESATAAIDADRFSDAVTETAFAFDKILKTSHIARYLERASMHNVAFLYGDPSGGNGNLRGYIDAINERMNELQQWITVLTLGIDFSRFAKFQTIVPELFTPSYCEEPKAFNRRSKDVPYTRVEAEFCLTFVIDSAFRIQEHPEIKI